MADKGLAAGLIGEYEAIYAYGIAGPHLSSQRAEVARSNERAHRDRRDAILVRLTKDKAKVPAAKAAYQLPDEVSDGKTAASLLSKIEESTTKRWRTVLADTEGKDRRAAAKAFSDSAVTLARWKRALGQSPSTTAFPGRELPIVKWPLRIQPFGGCPCMTW